MSTSYPPLAPFVWNKLDASGKLVPASGYVLSFFEPTSTTPKAVYAEDGTTSLGTTVTLNPSGYAFFRLNGRYKIVLKTDAGAEVWTRDLVESTADLNTSGWCGTATGTANAITLTPVPAITAYVAGQKFAFIAASTNTGPVTIAVSGLSAKAAQNYELALVSGEIVVGHKYEITYDGVSFQVDASGSAYARLKAANNFTVVPTINSSPIVDEADFTWITPAFNAADFSANGAMTWTVGSGDVVTYAYMIVGKMMIVNYYLNVTTVGGTLNSTLKIKIPAGKISAKRAAIPFNFADNGVEGTGISFIFEGDTIINLQKGIGGFINWAASTNNTTVAGSITFEIQ